MRYGYWLPVFGGWLRNVENESMSASWDYREKKEAASRARLEKGELGLDIYGMRKALEDKGLKYIDGPLD